MKPSLTWFINKAPVYNESYVGSFESTEAFEVELEVVNNFLGIEPVDEIKNGKLIIEFKDYEDSVLLQALQVMFDKSYTASTEIVGNRAYIKIPRVISGDYSSPESCTLHIKLTFNQAINVKDDLKQLIVDILY